MFANPFVNQAALAGFAALLVAAAVEDARHLTISNRYCLAITLLYPLYALSSLQSVDWPGGLLVGGIALVIGFVLFAMGWIGGGDAKLLAATATWAGPALLAELVFTTAIAGGAVAIIMLVRRYVTRPASARTTTLSPHGIRATVTVFLGNLLMARQGAAIAASGAQAPRRGDHDIPDTRRSAEVLPYGIAIAIGGLMVTALLMMRG